MTDSKHADTESTKRTPAQQLVEDSLKAPDEASNLATIRDILFGEQVRDVEKKRQDLQHTLQTELNSLRQDIQAQFEQLSADIQTLYCLLNDETKQRHSDIKTKQKQLDQLQSSLQQANLKHQQAQDKLHKKLLNETSRLEQQARQWNDEISEKLEHAAKELKSDKADRGDLAKMLRGVAEQLLDEQQH